MDDSGRGSSTLPALASVLSGTIPATCHCTDEPRVVYQYRVKESWIFVKISRADIHVCVVFGSINKLFICGVTIENQLQSMEVHRNYLSYK